MSVAIHQVIAAKVNVPSTYKVIARRHSEQLKPPIIVYSNVMDINLAHQRAENGNRHDGDYYSYWVEEQL